MKTNNIGPKTIRQAPQTVSTRASQRRAAVESQHSSEDAAPVGDSFESAPLAANRHITGSATGLGLDPNADMRDLADLSGERVSQISQVVTAIEDKTKVLSSQFAALKTQSNALVQQLAETGFKPQQLSELRPALDQLRGQMRQVRGRLNWGQRRIKALRTGMQNTPGLDFAALRRSHLADKGQTNASWKRGLNLIANAGKLIPGRSVDGQSVARVQLGGASSLDRHALGQYLAQISPSALAQRLTAGLIRAGRALKVTDPVEPDFSQLDKDVRMGRAGKSLEELAKIRKNLK